MMTTLRLRKLEIRAVVLFLALASVGSIPRPAWGGEKEDLEAKLQAAKDDNDRDAVAQITAALKELDSRKTEGPPTKKTDEPVAKVGEQDIKGWEQDSLPIKNAINEQIRQANENIRNWESAQRVGSAASRGMKHRNGNSDGSNDDSADSDFQEETQSAPPKPTIQDAIRAAGLPPKGFVYSRVPNADGSIKFKIYAWPPDQAQEITRAANEALNARELQFALANGVPGGSTQSGVSGTSSNSSNGGITNNLNLNIPLFRDGSLSDGEKKKETKEAVKAKPKANPKQKSDPFAGLQDAYKMGKMDGLAQGKATESKNGKPSAEPLDELGDQDGGFTFVPPGRTPTSKNGAKDKREGQRSPNSIDDTSWSPGFDAWQILKWTILILMFSLVITVIYFHTFKRQTVTPTPSDSPLPPVPTPPKESGKKGHSANKTAVTKADPPTDPTRYFPPKRK